MNASANQAREVQEAMVAAVSAYGSADYRGAEAVAAGVDLVGANALLTTWVWHLLVTVYGSPEDAKLACSTWVSGDPLPAGRDR